MRPWEEFRRKYPSGEVMYSIDGEYLGLIRINALDVLCGYVILPKNHPYIGLSLYKDDYDKNPLYVLDVHVGVTFADYINENDYAIGFDCSNHYAGDYVPRIYDFKPSANGVVWRDETFVINELNRLVEQLKEAELQRGGKDE